MIIQLGYLAVEACLDLLEACFDMNKNKLCRWPFQLFLHSSYLVDLIVYCAHMYSSWMILCGGNNVDADKRLYDSRFQLFHIMIPCNRCGDVMLVKRLSCDEWSIVSILYLDPHQNSSYTVADSTFAGAYLTEFITGLWIDWRLGLFNNELVLMHLCDFFLRYSAVSPSSPTSQATGTRVSALQAYVGHGCWCSTMTGTAQMSRDIKQSMRHSM